MGPKHHKAFNILKEKLTNASLLQNYDSQKPLVLQADASTKGLRAALLHENKPVYFISKAPQPCQRKYVTIELKALPVGWAMKNSITT